MIGLHLFLVRLSVEVRVTGEASTQRILTTCEVIAHDADEAKDIGLRAYEESNPQGPFIKGVPAEVLSKRVFEVVKTGEASAYSLTRGWMGGVV